MQKIKYGILIAITVLATIIVIQNMGSVTIGILLWDFSLPVIVLAVLFFLAGAVAGLTFARLKKRKSKAD